MSSYMNILNKRTKPTFGSRKPFSNISNINKKNTSNGPSLGAYKHNTSSRLAMKLKPIKKTALSRKPTTTKTIIDKENQLNSLRSRGIETKFRTKKQINDSFKSLNNNKQVLQKQSTNKRENITTSLKNLTINETKTQNLNKTPTKLKNENVLDKMKSPGFDTANMENPQQVSEFVKDIIEHLRVIETDYLVKKGFMKGQREVSTYNREKIVNFISSMCYTWKIKLQTLYLAINYLDRYLQMYQVKRSSVQLISIGCLFVASKYEEIYPPQISQLIKACVCEPPLPSITKKQIIGMEKIILSSLNFNLTVATAYPFLKRYLMTDHTPKKIQNVAYYLSEMTLLKHEFSSIPPSKIAAASVFLAHLFTNTPSPNGTFWSDTVKYYSKYEIKDFIVVAKMIYKMMKEYESQKKARIFPIYYSSKKKSYATLRVRSFLNNNPNYSLSQ